MVPVRGLDFFDLRDLAPASALCQVVVFHLD